MNHYGKIPFIGMECDGALVENLTDYQPRSHSEALSEGYALTPSNLDKHHVSVCAVKMNPPTAPVVNTTTNDNWILWGPSAPWSRFESGEFHAQIKQADQEWKVSARNSAWINDHFNDNAMICKVLGLTPDAQKTWKALRAPPWHP